METQWAELTHYDNLKEIIMFKVTMTTKTKRALYDMMQAYIVGLDV